MNTEKMAKEVASEEAGDALAVISFGSLALLVAVLTLCPLLTCVAVVYIVAEAAVRIAG